LDNFDEIFGKYVDTDEVIADYYCEICLNLPVIYLMLGRMKDIDESWDRISAICEQREAYKVSFAKFKLMQVSINLKSKMHLETLQMDIGTARQIFNESIESV